MYPVATMTSQSKRQFVQALQEGDVIDDYFVAVRKDLREQHGGGKFLGMVFKDRTGEIGGILWNNAVAVVRQFELGDVVSVRGTVSSYQGRLQIRVERVLPLRDGEFSLDDLAAAPGNTAEQLGELRSLIETIQEPHLAQLCQAFLSDEGFIARFCSAAAGKKWHHALPGGLVAHCLEMARLAVASCEVFEEVDRDLLLAAVLLHDIGKLDELSQGLMVDYTTRGKLLGHLHIGIDMVQERINGIAGFPDGLRLELLHCLLAHHGTLENGSPVVPKSTEALILYHVDDLSAQVNAFSRIIAETRDRGESWSDYVPLIERQVWTKDQ